MVISNDSQQPVRVLSFDIPTEDHDEFYALSADVQRDVRNRLDAMRTLSQARSVRAGALMVSALMEKRAGWSVQRLCTQWREYSTSGNWRVLLNRAKAGPTHYRNSGSIADLPAASNKIFREWVMMMIERCQRNGGQAYKEIIAQWRRWRAGDQSARIPGFSIPPEPAMHGFHPVGWSRDNIMRMSSDIADLTRARIGQSAAARFSPSILTTRVQMRVGQFYEHDDVMLDFLVNYPGQRTAVRPRGFFTNDSLSTANTLISFKPYLWDLDEKKRQDLTEREFFWQFLQNLLTNGYRTDDVGTTNLLENAKATIRDTRMLENLERETNGKVLCLFGAIHGHKQLAGYFEGRGHGNPRHKARRESLFNVVHNYLQQIPGQVGLNRDRSPEQLHGMTKANERDLALIAQLSPERGNLIQTHFLSWEEFQTRCMEKMDELDRRHDHEMEGWDAYWGEFYRLVDGGQWVSKDEFENYNELARNAMMTVVAQDPQNLHLRRRLSPWEVYRKFKHELTPLNHIQLPTILSHRAEEFGRPVTVRKGFFEVKCAEAGTDSFFFHAMDARRGRAFPLPEGEKYFAFFNPYNPDVLVACDAHMRPAAVCRLWERVDAADSEAVTAALGKKSHHDAVRFGRQDARHITFAAQHSKAVKHNKAVRDGKAVTPEEIEAQRDLANRVALHGASAASDMLGSPEEPTDVSEAPTPSTRDFLSSITSGDE